VTRWYRAPEVVMHPSHYTTAIDVWAVGCILCELVGRRPVFCGKDYIDQLRQVFAVIGKPTEMDLDWLPSESAAHAFVRRLPETPKRPWARLYPSSSSKAHEAMEAMLTLQPQSRATAKAAVRLALFVELHLPDDEPEAEPLDWSFDKFRPTRRGLQDRIYAECLRYHPCIEARDEESLQGHNAQCVRPAGA